MNDQLILKAAHFASVKHRKQKRKDKDKTPYINHPISVAMIISEIGEIDDPEVLAAAILHDTIEDTETSLDDLEDKFGEQVRTFVEEVTDDKTLPKVVRKQRQIDHAKELSEGAALIKLGDKISNVMDITKTPPIEWDAKRCLKYFDWAEAVINNCPKVNNNLENLFFEVLQSGRNSITLKQG